jgi:pimeloyl-ACP methyl ester carboxylesterase
MKFPPSVRVLMLQLSVIALAAGLYGLWTPDLSPGELQKRYGVPGQQVLEVDGLRIHYQDIGPHEAPVLILLHGFGSSLQTWNAWIPVLADHYRVIRLDLPGFGLTGASPARDYSEARDVATLVQFADRLGLSRFSVIGHSLGGKIAWSLAAVEPERVEALVLIAPDGFATPAQWGTKPYDVSAVMRLMTYSLPRILVREFLGTAFSQPQSVTEPMVDRYHDMLRAPGVRKAILDRADQTVSINPMPYLQRIRAPTLLLWGGNDQMIPSSQAGNYAQVLPRSQTVVLPNLGHVLQEEQPETGLEQVQIFLDANLRPPHAQDR